MSWDFEVVGSLEPALSWEHDVDEELEPCPMVCWCWHEDDEAGELFETVVVHRETVVALVGIPSCSLSMIS